MPFAIMSVLQVGVFQLVVLIFKTNFVCKKVEWNYTYHDHVEFSNVKHKRQKWCLKFQKYAQNSTHGERFITEEATLLYEFAPGQLSV